MPEFWALREELPVLRYQTVAQQGADINASHVSRQFEVCIEAACITWSSLHLQARLSRMRTLQSGSHNHRLRDGR
jgi:hypothetical protein